MQYGLNNNLGSANNTNKTQNSSFVNTAKKYGKEFRNGLNMLNDFKTITEGKTGGDRIKAVADLIEKYI